MQSSYPFFPLPQLVVSSCSTFESILSGTRLPLHRVTIPNLERISPRTQTSHSNRQSTGLTRFIYFPNRTDVPIYIPHLTSASPLLPSPFPPKKTPLPE